MSSGRHPLPGAALAATILMAGAMPAAARFAATTDELPLRWNPESRENIRWVAELGTETYGGPVVAAGKVFVGTNNGKPRDPSVTGDRGILMAFRADDGALLWQAVHDKLPAGGEVDWPLQGICSTPSIAGDRIYYVSNRGELVAADVEGFLDGENDGPFTGESRRGPADADLIWILDMPVSLGVHPHRMSASSPLVVGDIVYTLTSNGVDEKGKVIAPAAPSFLAVNRLTGAVIWQSALPADRILDGQWANASHGVLGGRPQVLFPGGDGWLYSLDPATGALLWKFDAGAAPEGQPAGSPRESLVAQAVTADDRVFVGVGQDPERGPGKGRLWALSASGAPLWSLGGADFSRTLSRAAVADGLVYAADLRGFVYCIEAGTGKLLWSHDLFAQVWGAPLLAGGRVYIGDEDGDMAVLRAGRTKELLHEVNMGNAIYTTPAASAGALYIATRGKLFAVQQR